MSGGGGSLGAPWLLFGIAGAYSQDEVHIMLIRFMVVVLFVLGCSRDVFAYTLVTTQSDSQGTISVYVRNSGLATEQWKIDVYSNSDGSSYSFVYSTINGNISLSADDVSGVIYGDGSWLMTSLEPEWHGTQVYSNGSIYYPPGVTPPGGTPPFPIVIRGINTDPYMGHKGIGCIGNAAVAIGTYIQNGGAARAFISGAIRGSWTGGGAAGWGAIAMLMGVTTLVVDACMAH